MNQSWRWKKRGYDGRTTQERVARLFRHHVCTASKPRGRIHRLLCAFCVPNTQTSISQAHHVDYSRPFLVVWVCEPHHREVERGRKIHPSKLCDYSGLVAPLLRPGASETLRAQAAQKRQPSTSAPF